MISYSNNFKQIGKIWNFSSKGRKLLVGDNPGIGKDQYLSGFITVKQLYLASG